MDRPSRTRDFNSHWRARVTTWKAYGMAPHPKMPHRNTTTRSDGRLIHIHCKSAKQNDNKVYAPWRSMDHNRIVSDPRPSATALFRKSTIIATISAMVG